MDKYIFLDIDGVIATEEYLKDGLWALNPDKQTLLGQILSETDAKIVLTSSWRKSNIEDTKEHMDSEGFLFTDKIVGITIRAYQWLEHGTGIHLSIPRGVEIKQWVDTHIHSDNGKNWKRKKVGIDYSYVILDDDRDMLLEHRNNFVSTDSVKGLTQKDVELCISILNTTKTEVA